MKKELTPALLAEFLIEHPECHDGMMRANIGDGAEEVIDIPTLQKLVAFLVEKGLVSGRTAKRFLFDLKRQFKERGWEWPAE